MRWLLLGLLLAGCARQSPPLRQPRTVHHSFHVNFIPFGAGQAQNGHCAKAVGFAAAQGITAATSAGVWLYLMHTYGPNASVPLEEGPRVRRLQQIEISTGMSFLVLYAGGVIDGIWHFEPTVTIHPIAVDSGAGAGVSWSY